VNKILPIVIILFINCLNHSVLSQVNYFEGRIVTVNNDTIYGYIKDCGSIRHSRVCLFKNHMSDKSITKFYPNDIQSYMIFGHKYFVKQRVYYNNEFKDYFLDVLVDGNIKLYSFYKGKNIKYYIQRDNKELIPLINDLYVSARPKNHYSDNYTVMWHQHEFENKIYKDTLYSICRDNKYLKSQLINLEYNHKSLISFTKELLTTECEKDNCVTFERNLKTIETKFGFYMGSSFIKNFINGPDFQISIPIGTFFNQPLFLINERLSFQAEAYYSQMVFNHIKHDKIGFPIMLKHQFLSKDLSPVIGIGKELGYYFTENERYKSNKGSLVFDFGFNFVLNPNLSLFSNIRYQHYNIEEERLKSDFESFIENKGAKNIKLISIQLGIII
jgi:hypothetical protein